MDLETVRNALKLQGYTLASWARANGFTRSNAYDVFRSGSHRPGSTLDRTASALKVFIADGQTQPQLPRPPADQPANALGYWDVNHVRQSLTDNGYTLAEWALENNFSSPLINKALKQESWRAGTKLGDILKALLAFDSDILRPTEALKPGEAYASSKRDRAGITGSRDQARTDERAAIQALRGPPAITTTVSAALAGDPPASRSALGRVLRPGE